MGIDEAQQLLQELVSLGSENEWVEFKVNNGNPEEIGEYISALANSACLHGQRKGYLVYGVENDTNAIIGTRFKPKEARYKQQSLEHWLSISIRPRIDFKIHEFHFDEHFIAIFEIDAAPHTPVMFLNRSYIRVGSNKKPLNQYPEKERKIWSANTPVHFEMAIAVEGITQSRVLELLDHSSFTRLLELRTLRTAESILEALMQERLVIRAGTHYSITNLGAIAFARRLEEFPQLQNKSVRLIFYEGRNKLKTVREQVGVKGYAAGFEGLIGYMNSFLPMNEVIQQSLRTEVKMFPEIAIRELIANALIHQDFTQSGTHPMIEVYQDRIEITNNGTPLVNPLRFIDEVARSRNEGLAGLLKKARICEERGSGIDKVVAACEIFQLPAPEFIQMESHTKAILYAYKKLPEMNREEKIRACYQHACLKYVSVERLTNFSLRERFGIADQNYSIASRIIADTIGADLIKPSDPTNRSKKHAQYVPFWVNLT